MQETPENKGRKPHDDEKTKKTTKNRQNKTNGLVTKSMNECIDWSASAPCYRRWSVLENRKRGFPLVVQW
jgi:hypothetical protein